MGQRSKRKTIFSRYLAVSLSAVLVGFTLLGVMLVFFVTQFSHDEKQNLLVENAHSVSSVISSYSVIDGNKIEIVDYVRWQSVISTVATSIDADVFIADASGNIVIASNTSGVNYAGATIDSDIMTVALNRDYFENGKLGGIYDETHFTVGTPIIISKDSGQIAIGAVFISTASASMYYFAEEIVRIFIMAAIVTFAVMFCVVGVFTYSMVKPLRQMSAAAKKFGEGDFSSRVPVTSSDEIGQLACEFNNMADSLALSEGTRRSFVANVSHELKTPMTTIGGFVDGILDGTIPPERQSYYLNIVSVEVKRLSRLVQSMLALSRIDSGTMKLNKQRFNLTEVIIETLLTFEQKIDAKNINILGLEDISEINIDGDKDLLHQVVYNLMENAVKFTNEGGYIKISANNLADRTEISIENSGEGINSEEITHIFERFYKTDKSRSMDKNGMGLGLYIVKTILRLHGGDITASSELGKNCRFTFWLPAEKPKRQEKDKADHSQKLLKGGKKEEQTEDNLS